MPEKLRRKCKYRFNRHHETDNTCGSHGCQDNATISAVVLNNKKKRVWIIYKSTCGTTSMEYSEFKWVDTMIGNVKNSIHDTYHAISEKHVPRYLAEFCFRFNRRFELGKMIKQLAQAAVNTLPMPQRLLKQAEDWW